MSEVRLGRISYVNVLPIYEPIESGAVPGPLSVVAGPPAELNAALRAGGLDMSAASSIEYGRHPERYLLLPDLCIGSSGPVGSVLLLSRLPVPDLAGRRVLVSAETHTSAVLLRLLLERLLPAPACFVTAATPGLGTRLAGDEAPDAVLAIGDEALALAAHPAYPYRLDLGEAWRDLTGLPFVFGVWLARRESALEKPAAMAAAALALLAARDFSAARPERISRLAAARTGLTEEAMAAYFRGLVFSLGEREQAGLARFFELAAAAGIIAAVPPLDFLGAASRRAYARAMKPGFRSVALL